MRSATRSRHTLPWDLLIGAGAVLLSSPPRLGLEERVASSHARPLSRIAKLGVRTMAVSRNHWEGSTAHATVDGPLP